MRVKRYVVNALPEAVSLIRTELGKDAVILDTKEIRVGGFMGMFGKKKMEVIAALESGTSASEAPVQRPSANAEVSAFVEQILQTARRSGQAAAPASPVMTAQTAPAPAASAAAPSRTEGRSDNDRQSSLQEGERARDLLIMNEIREIREQMVKLFRQQDVSVGLSAPLQSLKERLLAQEVDAERVERLLESVREAESQSGGPLDREQVWQLARQQLQDWLQPFGGANWNSGARVVHFVGPTGVGKTTTIAKLAAEQTIKHGKKIGFITADTYRIAAIEQLKTYAGILNIPLEVVFSPMDLPKAYRALNERELILMDTAGRNFRSELHVSEVNSLLQTDDASETILVLSMTGKSADMAAIAERFTKFGIRKVLFTKLDETALYGSILNLILDYELQPTHLACGQTVPDDIEPFDVAKYVALLTGEPNDE